MNGPPKYNFVKIGNGRLALNHRPGGSDFALLRELGCTHVVTLLKESEFAGRIGNQTRKASLEWIWLPVPKEKSMIVCWLRCLYSHNCWMKANPCSFIVRQVFIAPAWWHTDFSVGGVWGGRRRWKQ